MILADADNTNTAWHVLGVGAIGGLFAVDLATAGTPVNLLLREPKAIEAYRRAGGLQLYRGNKLIDTIMPEATSTSTDTGAIRQLLLTTKSYDAKSALGSVLHRLAEGANVILMVNGMGVAERLLELLAQRRDIKLFCATTTEGAYRRQRFTIEHAGRGRTLVGAFASDAGAAPPWVGQWRRGTLGVTWCDDIQHQLWQKMAINCAINPLTALYKCRNGELAQNNVYWQSVSRLCDEIAATGAAAGFDSDKDNLIATVKDVVTATADNVSSMLEDSRAGRRTEIEDITGYLVNRATELGVETPYNKALLDQLRASA